MSAKSRASLFRAKLAQQLLSGSKGFTLIELLVVVVIVGILSAVAVPTFLNQVRRSRVAEAQSALSDVRIASEAYRLGTEGVYPNDFKAIEAGGKNGKLYMQDPWSAKAPNYDPPNATKGAGTSTGILWVTTAQKKAKAYRNTAGKQLECTLGLGKFVKKTDFQKGCNVSG